MVREVARDGGSRLVVGLISGTSVDAIDAALVRVADAADGARRRVELLAATETPFAPALRAAIFDLFPPHRGSVAAAATLDVLLGEAFARAALDLLAGAGIDPADVDLIGSHGQTVYHAARPGRRRGRPAPAVTVQLGSGAVIAARTGITTVYDFRVADLARGGEGAPLTPYVDYLLFGDARSLAIQNLGGIGNVTVLQRGRGAAGVFAFDTGPGNMVIDALVASVTGGRQRYDLDGALAAAGQPDEALLDELLTHPYFVRQPPKSTGREEFGMDYAALLYARGRARGLGDADLVATATALTARSIADAYRRFLPADAPVEEVLLCGGGARNPTLRRMLAAALAPLPVHRLDDVGISADAREAVAFAVLAYETACGRPGSLPGITGVREPTVLGAIAPGRGFRLWPG